MSITVQDSDQNRAGIWYGIAAYSVWGFLPLYWKLMVAVPAIEILAHRILWSFVVMAIVVVISGGWKRLVNTLTDKKKLFLMFFCGFTVSANWFTYIYAVNSGHVIEASMGYFINPLVVVMLGVTVFREKLTRWQLTAIILAALGVLIITVHYGQIPWIALLLAGTFAIYGLTKKIAGVDPVTGLVLETSIVMPFALIYIISLEAGNVGALGTVPWLTKIILAGTGIITATPLFLYARGIEKTTFSMMGFLQYIAPSINLFLGIFIFKEYFSLAHFISFCFIWVALAIFTLANTGVLKEPDLVKADQHKPLKGA